MHAYYVCMYMRIMTCMHNYGSVYKSEVKVHMQLHHFLITYGYDFCDASVSSVRLIPHCHGFTIQGIWL